MRLTKYSLSSMLFIILIQLTPHANARVESPNITTAHTLNHALKNRYLSPNVCIHETQPYVDAKVNFKDNSTDNIISVLNSSNPVGLLAFCHLQLNHYSQAASLLMPLFNGTVLSTKKIQALSIIALNIPETERPMISNKELIRLTSNQLALLKKLPVKNKKQLEISLYFSQIQLFLNDNNYQQAGHSIELIKDKLENYKNTYYNALLSFYYGLYYVKINQPQLAISSLLYANQLVDAIEYLDLSRKIKTALSQLYQAKHQFKRALIFSTQNVDMQMRTDNSIKQAESLIELAVLKRKNKEYNTGATYLFNALELITKDHNRKLLADIFFELGQNYAFEFQETHSKQTLRLALKYLQNARRDFSELGKTKLEIESLLLLAKLNISTKEVALAILQLEKLIEKSEDNFPRLRVQAYEMLALSYEISGDPQRAILHFKNFYNLQNKIKAHLFRLQQLQISEQLHLFEATKNHQKLEVENKTLKQANLISAQQANLFKSVVAILVLLILYFLIKSHRLASSERKARFKLSFHGRTALRTQYTIEHHYKNLYRGNRLYYVLVYIPYLSQLNLTQGLLKGKKIERRMGALLQQYFKDKAHIFHIRDSQILFVSEENLHRNSTEFALKIEQFFTLFSEKYRLPDQISMGVTSFPFLSHAKKAVSPERTVNIASLALFGSRKLQAQSRQTTWVELCPMENLSPAFVDGNLWSIGQQGISKGVIKVKSSHPEFNIEWPEITGKN